MRRNRRLAGIAATLGLAAAVLVGLPASPAQAVLPTSACTVSGPLSPRFASPFWGESVLSPFVQFQVNNGGGAYAGVFQDDNYPAQAIHLLYYSGGRVTFLDSYRESGVYEAIDQSMEAVGFDASGYVVARIQRSQAFDYSGWRYDLHGNKWMLQDSPQWRSVEPIGVTGSGTIVGNAYYLNGDPQIVSWTGTGRGQVHLLSPIGDRVDAVDQRGDIFFNQPPSGGTTYVRQPSGIVNLLQDFMANESQPNASVLRTSSTSGYGDTNGTNGSLVAGRWDVPAGSAAPVVPHTIGYLVHVDAVGLGGDVVGQYPGSAGIDRGARVLVRSTGKAYRLPPQYTGWYVEPHTVVNRYGQVVYTGADGLPHLFTCPA